ncbi:MAG: GNAT family N-acetyltransferase [Planctomycetes bacterium]|nr:GNAT family N-acetyltransferase [Planctomycetota bacterium]
MNPALLWKKLVRNYRDYGWQAVPKTAKALLSPLYQRNVYRIYVLDLKSPNIPPPGPCTDLDLVLVSPRQTGLIQQVENSAEWLQGKLAARLQSGDLCVAAVQGETLAGFNLITFGDAYIPLLKMTRCFRVGTAWSDHIAVLPAFRRGGLAKALRLRVFRELANRGIQKLYGGALTSNEPSLKLARSLGFRELADVTYRKLGSRKSWHYQRCLRQRANMRASALGATRFAEST